MKRFLVALLVVLSIGCTESEINPIIESNVPKPVEGLNYYQLHQYDFDGNNEKHQIMVAYVQDIESHSSSRIAASYSTVANGQWTSDETWGTTAPNDTIKTNNNFEIKHFVGAKNLIFENNVDFNIRNGGILELDTIDFKNNININIDSGGILIVRGDFLGKNNINVSNGGIVAIGGNYDVKSGVVNNNSNSFYVCGETDATVNSNSEKSCTDLGTEYPEIWEVINGGSLPITLLYQRTTIYDEYILIEFETASEHDSDFVIVNWSTDGKTWHPIDTIQSNNKPSYYSTKHLF